MPVEGAIPHIPGIEMYGNSVLSKGSAVTCQQNRETRIIAAKLVGANVVPRACSLHYALFGPIRAVAPTAPSLSG